jgi:hypothetical protein
LKVVPTGSWRIGESEEVVLMSGNKMPYPMSGERKSARTWASAGGCNGSYRTVGFSLNGGVFAGSK